VYGIQRPDRAAGGGIRGRIPPGPSDADLTTLTTSQADHRSENQASFFLFFVVLATMAGPTRQFSVGRIAVDVRRVLGRLTGNLAAKPRSGGRYFLASVPALSKLLVSSVTEGDVFRMLAHTQPGILARFRREDVRLELGAFVISIAERLILGNAARTIRILFSSLQLDHLA